MIELERQAPATEVPVRTAKDVLRNAARIIEERGWCQGAFEDDAGRVCLIGALHIADHGFSSPVPNITAADVAWDMIAHRLGTGPATWNDEYGRTPAQVIAALRAAADAA